MFSFMRSGDINKISGGKGPCLMTHLPLTTWQPIRYCRKPPNTSSTYVKVG